ncbi:MAG: hypothetical protein Q9212_003716 [Teloschistes hypoglaucus]
MPTPLLQDLPPELLAHIVFYLDTARSLVSLAASSRKLYCYVRDDGYQAFVQSHYPSISTPPLWKEATRGLTSLSRAWERKSLIARCIGPPLLDESSRPFLRHGPRRQTMGYQPVIDSYETFLGSSWTSRREVLAWGAGAELILRVKWKGPEVEKEYLHALRNKEDVASFDQYNHKVRWWRVKDPTHQDGKDDITAIKLLKDSQKPSPWSEYLVVGRATGELTMISVDHKSEGLWQTKTRFFHGGHTVRFATVSSAAEPSLAACIGDHTIALYAVKSDNESVEPLRLIQIQPFPNKACRLWSAVFLRQDRLAVGLGPSIEPIQVFDVSCEATPSKPFRTFSVGGGSAKHDARLTVYSLAPLPPSSRGRKSEGHRFLSGGFDGAIRAYVATFTDPVDSCSAVYSLLPLGCDQFLAGSANHSLLKVFNLRLALEELGRKESSAAYSTERAVGSDPFSQRDSAVAPEGVSLDAPGFVGILPDSSSRSGTSNIAHTGIGSRSSSSKTQELNNWNVFLANSNHRPGPTWRAIRASPVYSLSCPSLLSPTFYAGIEGNVVQVDLTATDDNFPDPILQLAPRPKGKKYPDLRKKHYDDDVMCLAMYEQVTSPIKLRRQVGPGQSGDHIPGWDIEAPVQDGAEIVYLPAIPTPQLQSFSAPILNLQDTRVDAPFFGANSWTGILKPVGGGGIAPHHVLVKLSMTFKDGGAFDFATIYERIKETVSQAVEMARESGRQQGPNLSDINLEQLPAYEEVGNTVPAPPPPLHQPTAISPTAPSHAPSRDSGVVLSSDDERNAKPSTMEASDQQYPPPNEPPPGYEEVVAEDLEHNLRIEH